MDSKSSLASTTAKRHCRYLGLTRRQYAWLKGYPSATFGTLPRLHKLRRWRYANISFPITVTFDREGRVVAREVPQLP
jgi:hypothetical protein